MKSAEVKQSVSPYSDETVACLSEIVQVVRGCAGRRIRTHGRLTEATVVKVWDTGTTINKNPMIGLRLKIEAASDHPAFEAETTQLVSRLERGHVQVGTRVPVKYLPDSREVALAH